MNENVTDLQKSGLKVVVEDAKQRIAFYYRSIFDEEKVQEILKELDSYYYGFDLDYDASAYCNGVNHEIRVTSIFVSLENYEKRVGIMIHEMNHAISHANKLSGESKEEYNDANYVDSYKLIEEGLADFMSELIMNYYYDKKNPSVNYEPFRVNESFCGYSYYREVIKTLLAIMELQGIDKEMLQEYYFGDRSKFFKCIVQLGGEKIFDLIKRTENDDTIRDMGLELFRVLEKNWGEAISNNSSMIFSNPNFNNLYYSNNLLLKRVHINYCIEKIIKYNNIDIDNATLEDIQIIDNAIDGLLKEIVDYFVPSIVDRLVVSCINNSKLEEINELKRTFPNIYNIESGKYYKLLTEKVLNEENGKEISDKNLSVLLNALTYDPSLDYSISNNEVIPSEYITTFASSFYLFATEVYPKMNEKQKDLYNANYKLTFKAADYILARESINKEFLEACNISSIDDLDIVNIIALFNGHQELIAKINEYNLYEIITAVADVWLTEMIGDPCYVFEVFPNALNYKKTIDTLKDTWGFSDESIERMKNEILKGKNDKNK